MLNRRVSGVTVDSDSDGSTSISGSNNIGLPSPPLSSTESTMTIEYYSATARKAAYVVARAQDKPVSPTEVDVSDNNGFKGALLSSHKANPPSLDADAALRRLRKRIKLEH
ncbi:hypothetical protein E3Q23_03653 [Wallemia mellicola]|nr:hypothetical protein E3Q23_03653 [Wallemia mellicola]